MDPLGDNHGVDVELTGTLPSSHGTARDARLWHLSPNAGRPRDGRRSRDSRPDVPLCAAGRDCCAVVPGTVFCLLACRIVPRMGVR